MTRIILKGISYFFFISILSFSLHAADLQAFIQDADTVTTEAVSQVITPTNTSPESDTNTKLTYLVELVVAGIVASALIISVLILFLGRWAGRREKKVIKNIRIQAEEDQEHIVAAAATVREQEKETTKIIHKIRDDAKEFSVKKEVIENFDNDVKEITHQAKAKTQEIEEITNIVNENVEQVKHYWDEKLVSTLSTMEKVQGGLDKGLNQIDKNLDEMLQQKIQSEELFSEYMSQHNEQLKVINKTAISSEALNKNLKDTLQESTQLLKQLKKHQKSAEKSLDKFTQELTAYEEQAYEQFDTSFQVADLARQELNANIDESRKHIETMRRHEEQSHTINTHTQKNLKSLDFSKIAKLSHTLDSTFSMFTDMSDKVDETRAMLDQLNDMEADIKKSPDSPITKQKMQLAKEVELVKPKTPKIDLNKPTITAKPDTALPVPKKIIETKPEPKKVAEFQAEPKKIIDDKPGPKTTTKTNPKTVSKTKKKPKTKSVASNEIKTKKPALEAIETTPSNDIITTKNDTSPIQEPISNKVASPKKTTMKAAKSKPKTSVKKMPVIKTRTIQIKEEKEITSSKLKTKKAISEDKPSVTNKENSITGSIEEAVEIKSLLSSSEVSKTAYKMAKPDNVPVSFFTNVKKNSSEEAENVGKKNEPILGSMKRTFLGK